MSNQQLRCALAVAAALGAGPCLGAETVDAVDPTGRETPAVTQPPPPGVPALQMSPDFSAPGMSFGTYQPMGQVQSRGVRVEPFTVRAALQTGLGYDDNVALTQVNRTSSMFLSISPSVAVGLEGATQRYYVVYRGNYGRYASSSVDNYEDHNIGLSAANELTTRLRSLFRYDYLRGHEGRGATTTGLAAPEEWREHAVRGSVSYGAAGAQGLVEADVGYADRRYLTNRAVTAVRDYDRFELGGAFSYRLAPKTRTLVQIVRTAVTHEFAPGLDSTEMRYLAGVSWEGTAKTQGTLRAGYMTKDIEAAASPDFSGPTYEATVVWSPLTYSVVDFAARRIFGEAAEPGSSYIVNNIAATTWNHAWSDRVRSTLAYLYGRQSHEGIARTDTYHSFGLRVSYAMRRALHVGAEYRRDARDSNAANQEFSRNLMLVTLETAL